MAYDVPHISGLGKFDDFKETPKKTHAWEKIVVFWTH